jgi:exopolysaccharide biosynthesis polyprenyl glycosylphosphotransferase
MRATGGIATTDFQITRVASRSSHGPAWLSVYLCIAVAADLVSALTGGVLATRIRFLGHGHVATAYLALSCALPVLWGISVMLAGGYEARFIGLGSDEYRRVLNAGMGLAAAIAIVSYAAKLEIARGYMAVALPATVCLDLATRYVLRKQLHRMRDRGICIRRVVAVGHLAGVAELVATLRRNSHHGLSVVAACVVDYYAQADVEGVAVVGALDCVPVAVSRYGADTVAVLSCPEIGGIRLRNLAWELEKTGTELCVAPAMLDVVGPRVTLRPVGGLPILHLDHAKLSGGKQLIKSFVEKILAGLILAVLAPVLFSISIAIRRCDGGPVLFRQTRVGRGGETFTLYKFRTMLVDAEQLKSELLARNDADGALFKMRSDPRVTSVGALLRRWSLDELPQLINVIRGDMSLVGPRPALPEETDLYGGDMRRRLAVRPGITGLWQVSGRSDLPWSEAVRLDIRYVDNWSLVLDLQILLKTGSAVMHGSGAY